MDDGAGARPAHRQGAFIRNVTFDALDPPLLASFWAAALGWEVVPEPPEIVREMLASGMTAEEVRLHSATVEPTDGSALRLYFNRVAEPKTVKDRIHLDLEVEDREAEVARLVELGATRLNDAEDVFGSFRESWTVMLDPEGNEFCVQAPTADYQAPTS